MKGASGPRRTKKHTEHEEGTEEDSVQGICIPAQGIAIEQALQPPMQSHFVYTKGFLVATLLLSAVLYPSLQPPARKSVFPAQCKSL